MEALFLKLVNMSISASWLVLAVVVLRFLMKKAPKWMTCALWALVAIRLVFPFSVESMFSLIPEPVSSGKIVDSITDDYWGATHIYHDNTDEYQIAVGAGRDPIHIGDGHYYVVTGEDGVSEPATIENTVVPVLGNIWITGMAVMALYATVSYLLIRRKVSASLHLRDNLYLCDYIESPFILGILRPRIYLPSVLDQSQWPHVIAHEKAHLARRDHWWKPLGFAILCVYWFNPVLWLAYILLCRDIELACDERVIRDMDTRQKQDYTTALLECSMPRYLIAACPLAFGEVGVKERVKTVLNYKKPAFWIILIALVLCIAAAVCFLTDPVGNSTITPGVYEIDTMLYQEGLSYGGHAQPVILDGQYILQNNTLYYDDYAEITVLGTMQDYDLDNAELRSYLPVDDWWQNPFHHIPTISQALWLRMDDGTFYIWFQTNNGKTYLARGWEDIFERFTDSDDTYITQLCRLTLDEEAEEMELSWFDADILEVRDTWLLVAPITGSWEAEQYGQIEVSRWWHTTSTNFLGQEIAIDGILTGEFSEGDRVRIVYDGYIQETSPARISTTYSTTKLPGQDTPPVDDYPVTPAGLQFFATVLEVTDSSILVEPLPGTVNHPGTDRIWVLRTLADSGESVLNIAVGDTVSILYDGMVAETYPAQINTVYEIRKQSALDVPKQPLAQYNSIVEAILDDCVASINGDVVAGQQHWQAFLKQTQLGQSASVRLVTYLTLSSPANINPGDFPDIFEQYPLLSIHDLSYDGTQYTLRTYENGTEYVDTYPYLIHYSNIEYRQTYLDYYVLTNTPDLSWKDYWDSIVISSTPIRAYPPYSDRLYDHEPNQAELEAAKDALEPYMREFKIATLDANELTGRLDVTVYEWVDGLDTLIEQYMDLDFVTITHQEGILAFTERNELISRFPEYFGLSTFNGLELYALEDGTYILMAGTNRNKTENEINALPRTNAEEMKQILESYTYIIDTRSIIIDNRTDRTEYDIRKELGIFPPCQVNIEITNATATEALITYNIYNLDDREVWTGYDYYLEVLTDDGWVHYGYPQEDLAWEEALLFSMSDSKQTPPPTNFQDSFLSHDRAVFVADWSRTADAPLSPGTYRYCKDVMILHGDEISAQSCYAVFEIPEDTPEDWGIHMEVLNPTDTGATLAITYNGGLMGELSTQGKYYLMVDVDGGTTRYGLTPSKVDWDDVRYSLPEGETVYLDVRWDHTAEATLPPGSYYVVLVIDQAVPYSGPSFHFDKYITESFAITD